MRWLAAVLVILLCGWGGSVWYAGSQVKAAYQQQAATLAEALPQLTFAGQTVHYGLMHSDAETQLEFRPDPCSTDTLKLLVHERFSHTALFEGGVVKSTIDLSFPQADSSELKSLFGDRKPLTINAEYRPGGRIDYHLKSPAMNLSEHEWSLDWRGMDMDIKLESAGNEMQLKGGGFDFSKSGHQFMSLTDLVSTSHSHKSAGGLMLGNYDVRIGEMDLSGPEAGQRLVFREAVLGAKLDGQGSQVGWNTTYSVGNIRMGDLFSGKGEADISVNHLNEQTLKRLVDSLRATSKVCKPDMAVYMDRFKDLLADAPALVINKLDVTWGDKTLHLDGYLKGLEGVKDSKSGLPSLTDDASHQLDARLRISANESFLTQFTGMSASAVPGSQMAMMHDLPYQELMRKENGNYVMEFVVKDGQTTLNGQPWNEVISNYRLQQSERQLQSLQNNAGLGQGGSQLDSKGSGGLRRNF